MPTLLQQILREKNLKRNRRNIRVGNTFLGSSLSEDESLVFDHGGDVQTVHGHQVHVRDLLGGGCDPLRELVLRVHEKNT